MRLPGFAAASSIPFDAMLVLLGWLCLADVTRAEELSPFLNIDAGACEQLDDKNLQVGPPDAEIVAACAVLHRGAVLGQRLSGGPGAVALALLGVVLVYAVLGAPLRSVAGLMGRPTGISTATLAIETVLAFLLRAGIAWLALAILTLPYATASGCIVILVTLILSLRAPRATPPQAATAPTPSPSSVVLADLINDLAASSAGILGLALLMRRDPWWLAVGLLLAAIVSVPTIVAARRSVRRDPTLRLAATIALAGVFGAVGVADANLADAFGDTLAPLASALVFSATVLGAGWIRRANSQSEPAAS